jgi:hypothetical protein
MNGKLSIIISVILVTAAILTVQSSHSSMLQSSYAQLCPEGAPVDASGNCPTDAPPPAGDEQTAQAPPPATETTDDGSFQVTPPPATEAPPPATTETPPPPATEDIPTVTSQVSNNTGGMSADWINSIWAVHNSERAAVGVEPLVWSDSLAAGAQTWAEYLAKTGISRHASQAQMRCLCGENIATFSWFAGPTAPGGGASLWVAEKQNYHGEPIDSTNYLTFGHYTQMVWSGTYVVGCGVAPPGAGGLPYSILVCRYNPQGNIFGQAPY